MNSQLWIFVNKTLCKLYGGAGGHRELKAMLSSGGRLMVSPRTPFDVEDPSAFRIEQTGLMLKREVERRRQQVAKRHAEEMAVIDAIEESVERWVDDKASAKRRRDDIADDAPLLAKLDEYVAGLEVIQ